MILIFIINTKINFCILLFNKFYVFGKWNKSLFKILQKKIELENLHYEGALKFQNETIDNSEHFISHVSDKYDNFSQKQSI